MPALLNDVATLSPAWNGFNPFLNGGGAINGPKQLPNLAASYDASVVSSMIVDAANRVSLWADRSGNSVNGLCLNGVAGNYASTPDSAAISITGDLDLQMNLSMADWTPGTDARVLGKWTATGNQRSYLVTVLTTGVLRFSQSTTGADATNFDSTVALPFTDYSTGWIRVALDVDNGAAGRTVTFYTSTDGIAWTPLGTSVTVATAVNTFDSTSALFIGSFDAGTLVAVGNIFRARILNGIGGTVAFDANFQTAAKLATSFTESSSNAATVTINTSGDTGARISGSLDLYQGTVSKQPAYLAWNGTHYGYVSSVTPVFYTPSSAALQAGSTSTIEIIARCAMIDWTAPVSETRIAAKYGYPDGNREWDFGWGAGTRLQFRASPDGVGATIVATASVDPGFTNGQFGWVRVLYTRDTGGGNYSIQFFTAADTNNNTPPSSWSALGSTITGASIAGCFAGTAPLMVGATGNTTTSVPATSCKFSYCDVKFAGTSVATFDATRYVSGTTFTDALANTWNIGGNNTIVTRTGIFGDGVDDYLKSPGFNFNQPETVYFTGQQVTTTLADYLYDGASNGTMGLRQDGANGLGLNAGSGPAASVTLALQTGAVLSAVFNGASSVNRINRQAAATGNPGAGNGAGFGPFSAAGTGAYSNITISELDLYSAAHDTTTQNRYIVYAGRKWRITV